MDVKKHFINPEWSDSDNRAYWEEGPPGKGPLYTVKAVKLSTGKKHTSRDWSTNDSLATIEPDEEEAEAIPREDGELQGTLTGHLLTVNESQYTKATQSPFVLQLATRDFPARQISLWLATDTVYSESYRMLASEMSSLLERYKELPQTEPETVLRSRMEVWLEDARRNSECEDMFFMNTKTSTKWKVDDTANSAGCLKHFNLRERSELKGAKKFVRLFDRLAMIYRLNQHAHVLPLLEGAIVFWATEKLLFETWLWAAKKAGAINEEGGDEQRMLRESDYSPKEELGQSEGFEQALLRQALIANWTSQEYKRFINRLRDIIDDGFDHAIGDNAGKKMEVIRRAERMWLEVLDAGVGFWPELLQVGE